MKRQVDSFRPFQFSPEFTSDANRETGIAMQQQDLIALISDTREATAELVRQNMAARTREDLERVNGQLQDALAAILKLTETINAPQFSARERNDAKAALGQIASELVDGQDDLFKQMTALHISETNLSDAGPFDTKGDADEKEPGA